MTPLALATLIRFKTKTNTTTFSDSVMLPLVNAYKDEISAKIIDQDAGYFLVPVTFDLVADQRQYALPEDTLNRQIQKLELKFDADDDYQVSTYLKEYRGSEAEDQITGQFTNTAGEFAHIIRRRAIIILSGTIAAVTDGARLWYAAHPADITDLTDSADDMSLDPTTTTFGFPKQFHELLASRVAIEYKNSQPKPIRLSKDEVNWENKLRERLGELTPEDTGGDLVSEDPSDIDTGHDGWEY